MAVVLKKYINKKGADIPHLYIDQNGFFWVRKRIGDTTPRKKLDTKIETVAKGKIYQAIKELEDEIEDKKKAAEALAKGLEHVSADGKQLLFNDFYDKVYNKKVVDGIRPSTLRRLRIIKEKSLEPSLFWNKKPSEITADDGIEFKQWHHKHRINKRTGKPVQLVNVMKYLGEVLRLMLDTGAITQKQMPDIDLPLAEVRHHNTNKGRAITREEFVEILNAYDPRFQLLPKLAHDLGNRKMELGSLKCSQVVKRNGKVFIDLSHADTKTGIPRIIPVPDDCVVELLERKQKHKVYIFESIRDENKHIAAGVIDQHWVAAKKAAKVQGRLRFHDLRDTAASNMVKAGLNPLMICTILGMSMTMLQKKYLQLKPEDLLIVVETMVALRKKGTTNG